MKLSSMVIAVLGLASTTLACTASEGCCWNNEEGCRNQHKSCKGIAGNFFGCPCQKDSYKADFCKGFDCGGADCCDTTTHWGRSCP